MQCCLPFLSPTRADERLVMQFPVVSMNLIHAAAELFSAQFNDLFTGRSLLLGEPTLQTSSAVPFIVSVGLKHITTLLCDEMIRK